MSDAVDALFARFDETLRSGPPLTDLEARASQERLQAAQDRARRLLAQREAASHQSSAALASCERLRRLGTSNPGTIARAAVLVVRCAGEGHRLATVYRLRGRLLAWPEGRMDRARFLDDVPDAGCQVGCRCGQSVLPTTFLVDSIPPAGRAVVVAP